MRAKIPERLESGRVRSGPFATSPEDGPSGAFRVQGPCGMLLTIIASDGGDAMEQGWEHVSVSTKNRPPNWMEMCFVKDLFWSEEETVVQFHPPKAEYINNHPHTLHLWRDRGGHRLPPSIMVGVKGLDYEGARALSHALYGHDPLRQAKKEPP